MCTLLDFSVVKLDLFMRALLLDRILALEKTTCTPCVYLVNQQTVNQQHPAVREYQWGTNSNLFCYIHH